MLLNDVVFHGKIAWQKCFICNQIIKLTIKKFGNLSNINICYYLNFRIPMCHRQFLRNLSQNPEYVENFCNKLNNSFHFACWEEFCIIKQSKDTVYIKIIFQIYFYGNSIFQLSLILFPASPSEHSWQSSLSI